MSDFKNEEQNVAQGVQQDATSATAEVKQNVVAESAFDIDDLSEAEQKEVSEISDITLGKIQEKLQSVDAQLFEQDKACYVLIGDTKDNKFSAAEFEALRSASFLCEGEYVKKDDFKKSFDFGDESFKYNGAYKFKDRESAENFIGVSKAKGLDENRVLVTKESIVSALNVMKYSVMATENEVKLIYGKNDLNSEQFLSLYNKVKGTDKATLETTMYGSTVVTFPVHYNEKFVEKAHENDVKNNRPLRPFNVYANRNEAYRAMQEIKTEFDAIVKQNHAMDGIRDKAISYEVQLYVSAEAKKDANVMSAIQSLEASVSDKMGVFVVKEDKVSEKGNAYSTYTFSGNKSTVDVSEMMWMRDVVKEIQSKIDGKTIEPRVDVMYNMKQDTDFVTVKVTSLPREVFASVKKDAEGFGFKLKENKWNELKDGSIKATFIAVTGNNLQPIERKVAMNELQYNASVLQAKIASYETTISSCQRFKTELTESSKVLANVEKRVYANEVSPNKTYTIKDAPEVAMLRFKINEPDNKNLKVLVIVTFKDKVGIGLKSLLENEFGGKYMPFGYKDSSGERHSKCFVFDNEVTARAFLGEGIESIKESALFEGMGWDEFGKGESVEKERTIDNKEDVESPNIDMLISEAESRETSQDRLRELAKSQFDEVREKVADNPNTPADVLKGFCNGQEADNQVVHFAIQNPSMPAEELRILSSNSDVFIRFSVACNKSCPADVLEKFWKEESDKDIKKNVLLNPNTDINILLHQLQYGNDEWMNEFAEDGLMARLSGIDTKTLQEIVENLDVPFPIKLSEKNIEKLKDEAKSRGIEKTIDDKEEKESVFVSKLGASNLEEYADKIRTAELSEDDLKYILDYSQGYADVYSAILDRDSLPLSVMTDVAYIVRKNDDKPELVQKLIQHPDVQLGVVNDIYNNSKSEELRNSAYNRMVEIASNPNTSAERLDYLAQEYTNFPNEVLISAIKNPNSQELSLRQIMLRNPQGEVLDVLKDRYAEFWMKSESDSTLEFISQNKNMPIELFVNTFFNAEEGSITLDYAIDTLIDRVGEISDDDLMRIDATIQRDEFDLDIANEYKAVFFKEYDERKTRKEVVESVEQTINDKEEKKEVEREVVVSVKPIDEIEVPTKEEKMALMSRFVNSPNTSVIDEAFMDFAYLDAYASSVGEKLFDLSEREQEILRYTVKSYSEKSVNGLNRNGENFFVDVIRNNARHIKADVISDEFKKKFRGNENEAKARIQILWDEFIDKTGDVQSNAYSKNTSYYTPQAITTALADVVKSCGLKDGQKFGDFAVGMGAFIKDYKDKNINVVGVDIDTLASFTTKILYPNAEIINSPLQDVRTLNKDFDVTATNVPFSGNSLNVVDLSWNYNTFAQKIAKNSLHNYYIMKMLEQTKEGGMCMAITSTGFLDNSENAVRRDVANKAKLLGVVRLPSGVFADSVQTECDVLIFRKWKRGEEKTQKFDFVNSTDVSIVEKNENANKKGEAKDTYHVKYVNNIFADTYKEYAEKGKVEATTKGRDMILGDLSIGLRAGGNFVKKDFFVNPKRDNNSLNKSNVLDESEIAELSGRIRENLLLQVKEEGEFLSLVPEKIEEREAETIKTTFNHSVVIVEEDGIRVPHLEYFTYNVYGEQSSVIEKIDGLTDKQTVLLCDYADFRDAYKEHRKVAKETAKDANSEEFAKSLEHFREAYEKFVKKNGNLYDNKDLKFVQEYDKDYLDITFLERKNDKGEIETAELLERNIFANTKAKLPETIEEHILYSMNSKFGVIDVAYLEEQFGKDWQDVCKGEVFFDPEEERFVPKNIYLSGNLANKIAYINDSGLAEKYADNLTALRDALPKRIHIENIDIKGGVPYIPVDAYISFFDKINKDTYSAYYSFKYDSSVGTIVCENSKYSGKHDNSSLNSLISTLGFNQANDMPFDDSTDNAVKTKFGRLNNVVDSFMQGGIAKFVVARRKDESEEDFIRRKGRWEQDAKNCYEKLNSDFKKFILASPELSKKIEDEYNNALNSYVVPKFDGSFIEVD